MFIQAKNYHKGDNLPINRVVIHQMVSQEKPDTAETVAKWFASANAPMASAHQCIDSNSIVGCVHDEDIAYHAPPNSHSIGFEHAGKDEKWDTNPYESDELVLSAMLAAEYSRKYWLPVYWLSVADLQAGKRGFTSHYNVAQAFKKSTHTDGKLFPWERYLNMVRFFLNPQFQPNSPEGPDMANVADAVTSPEGGVWILAKDGGVFSYKGAQFYGSYPGLNIDDGNKRTFGNIEVRADGGYDLIATSNERYEFPKV